MLPVGVVWPAAQVVLYVCAAWWPCGHVAVSDFQLLCVSWRTIVWGFHAVCRWGFPSRWQRKGPPDRLRSRFDVGSRVALADGTELEADVVVTAIGDEPIGWLAGSGVLVDGSLRVDSRGRLRPDIVAAGDVAFFPTGRGVGRVPLWTSAIEQAKVAALGLLRATRPELSFQPYFWTEGFGLSLKAAGFTPVAGAPDYCEPGDDPGSVLLRWAIATVPGPPSPSTTGSPSRNCAGWRAEALQRSARRCP